MENRLRTLVVVMLFAAPGCASGVASYASARDVLPRAPTELGRCRVAASQSSPLVTEWPASEKANLEALLRTGAVAVAYSGCSMRLLPDCRVRGTYSWLRTTPSTDSLEINDTDELYAKLPLGAASLEGELKRSGKLTVKTVVSGQLKLDGAAVADVPADGMCAQATHLVTALSIGAFALTADGSRSGNVGASATLGEAKVQAERSAALLRSAGDFDSCNSSTAENPNGNCSSPVQVFLAPLPGRAADEGPPGTVKVDFISGNPASRWDVYADDQVICTTPCARFVHPARPLMLRTRDDGWMPADKVQVASLLDAGAGAHLQLRAQPTARGELVTGITFTAFSGMAAIAGIALSSLGCLATDSHGMCTAGLITLGAGGLALTGSIYLILDSLPHADVMPEDGGMMLARARQPRLVFGPGVIAGTF
ncbi:MAG TPA: hypothetical protein VIF57_16880 [Polyangia bacterium]